MPKQDPRTIEGSKERAEDRGRDALFGSLVSTETYLGDPVAVEGIVRSFLSKLVNIRIAYHEDRRTGEEAAADVQEAAADWAAIFMGKAAGYAALKPWNSADGLGEYISTRVMPGQTQPETAVRDFMLHVAAEATAIMAEHESEAIDDEAAKFRTDALVEDTYRTLMGLPAGVGEEF